MTTKVNFYILGEDDYTNFYCRLIEKIYNRKHRVYIHTKDQAMAHKVDEALWTYKDTSFIPHNLYGEGPTPPPPVQIGYASTPKDHRDILINLSDTVPEFYQQFNRVLEIIANEDIATEQGRERYRQYRADNCKVETHPLSTNKS